MSDIPRYLVSRAALTADRYAYLVTDQIRMVTYADHVEAIQQAEQRGREDGLHKGALGEHHRGLLSYEQGQRDVYDNRFVFTHDQWADECDRLSELALAAAVQRVEAAWDLDVAPTNRHSHGDHCSDCAPWRAAIAAIKGEQA